MAARYNDAFSTEELFRRPEVMLINTHAVVRACLQKMIKTIGALILLWATAVFLGGFVASLKDDDFWTISFVALVEAAGLVNAAWGRRFDFFCTLTWLWDTLRPPVKHNQLDRQLHRTSCVMHVWSWLTTIILASIDFIVRLMLLHLMGLCAFIQCYYAGIVSYRLRQPDYGSGYKHGSQANLKSVMDLFYWACIAKGLMFVALALFVDIPGLFLLRMVRRQVGLGHAIVVNYSTATNLKCFNNLAALSNEHWNFITYGAGLLDSEMPEDTASGARVLATLIEQGIPVRRLLLRSPEHRIQKLIRALAWTSPAEREMRRLSSRVVEHVAHDLSLAQFPGALESISSLLDTEDLILHGMRILENLALDQHNCKVICSSDVLLSKIVAPVSSENLIQDTKTNAAWTTVVDGSLKLISRLMSSPDDTGKVMRPRIANNRRAVKNLEEILDLEIDISNITVLQVRAIEILEQLCSGESISPHWTRERTKKVLNIFLTDQWMQDYLSKTRAMIEGETAGEGQPARQALQENKMKAAEDTVIQLKERAGEELTKLRMRDQISSEDIRSFRGCGEVVRYLTEMLDSDSERYTLRCRYSAAVILKHLCTNCTTLDQGYLNQTTLKKVLELLHINTTAQATSTFEQPCQRISQGHDETLRVRTEQRKLQVALLSLCTAIPDFAGVLPQLVSPEDLMEKLIRELAEENRYGTVSCPATVKLTCEIVMALIPHYHREEEVKMMKKIVDSLGHASERMAGPESRMLLAGTDPDCYGLPVRPFCSDLVKQARVLLRQKEENMGLPNV